jgi:hypothetical protein
MKNILLLYVLLLSGSVFAQWKPVAIDATGDVYSLDYSTVRKEGQIVRLQMV